MSFPTYRLKQHLRTVGEGATETHYGEVEAIIKQDHAEARVQVYSELVANRLAALIGVDVATGALVAHDTGLKYASLRLANIARGATRIETKKQFRRACNRYADQCAGIAVFDLWIGNEDRVGNLTASIGPNAEHLIVAFDHGRTLLGCVDGLFEALDYLRGPDVPNTHPMAGTLDRDRCVLMVQRIQNIEEELIYEVCDLGDTCGSVMPVDQVQLGEALVERRAFLPEVVERVLFPDESIDGKPS